MSEGATPPVDLQSRKYRYRDSEFAVYIRYVGTFLWGSDLDWTLTQAGLSEPDYFRYAHGEWPAPTNPYVFNRIVIAFREALERVQRGQEQRKDDVRNFWRDIESREVPTNVTALK